jgi:hypothetical protein
MKRFASSAGGSPGSPPVPTQVADPGLLVEDKVENRVYQANGLPPMKKTRHARLRWEDLRKRTTAPNGQVLTNGGQGLSSRLPASPKGALLDYGIQPPL